MKLLEYILVILVKAVIAQNVMVLVKTVDVINATGYPTLSYNQDIFDGCVLVLGIGNCSAVQSKKSSPTIKSLLSNTTSQVLLSGLDFDDFYDPLAQNIPTVNFTVIDSLNGEILSQSNLQIIQFDESQLGYLAGIVAGLFTTNKNVAVVSGMPFLPFLRYNNGFKQVLLNLTKGST